MKQIILLLMLISSSQFVFGQVNLELGTKWTYSQNLIGGLIEPTYIEITGDTLISGIKWYKIEGQGACAFNQSNPPLVREENSKWYTYNLDNQEESILYDFNLNIGDTYSVGFFGENYQIEMLIDSTSTHEINGVNRKIQYCSNPNSDIDGFFFGAEIIEGVGSLGYLFPQGNICDPHAGPIRCFENENHFIDFDIDRECDESYFPTNTVEIKNFELKIYPNPAKTNQIVFIEAAEIIENLIICNAIGEVVVDTKPEKLKTHVTIKNNGLYYIQIESLTNKKTIKLVITDE